MRKVLLLLVPGIGALLGIPVVIALIIASVFTPAVGQHLADQACVTAPDTPPTGGTFPLVTGGTARGNVGGSAVWNVEGGLGFPLPPPGHTRRSSLTTPAAPIPPRVRALYVAAAYTYQVPWTLLAGIGMEETRHGTATGVSPAGAVGLMQFLPATFAQVGVDGNHDGRVDIHDDADSISSAANYLTRSGVTDGVRRALWTYNHADWYVNDVLAYAQAYGGGTVLGEPTACTGGPGDPTGDAALPPLPNDAIATVLTWADHHTGDRYVFGATGPTTWDCSSFTRAAYASVGIRLPRTAQGQRDWLATGHGTRIPPGEERPGDLIFWDSYRGPNRIGHVMLVWNPATQTTIEARDTRHGTGHFSYTTGHRHHIFEIWRVGRANRSVRLASTTGWMVPLDGRRRPHGHRSKPGTISAQEESTRTLPTASDRQGDTWHTRLA